MHYVYEPKKLFMFITFKKKNKILVRLQYNRMSVNMNYILHPLIHVSLQVDERNKN